MRKSNGFTLVELLATIVVITLVMGIAVPYVISVINSSKDKTTSIYLYTKRQKLHSGQETGVQSVEGPW